MAPDDQAIRPAEDKLASARDTVDWMLWFYRWIANPLLVWLLRSPLHFLVSGRIMLITYTGLRTGRRRTIPVSYQQAGSEITIRVRRHQEKRWWRNLGTDSPVELQLRGHRVRAIARAVADAGAVRVLVRPT